MPTIIISGNNKPFEEGGLNAIEAPNPFPAEKPIYCEVDLPDVLNMQGVNHYYHKANHDLPVKVFVVSWGDSVYVRAYPPSHANVGGKFQQFDFLKTDTPFVTVERISEASQRTRTINGWWNALTRSYEDRTEIHSYHNPYSPNVLPTEPYQWVQFRFTLDDGSVADATWGFKMPLWGEVSYSEDKDRITCKSEFLGATKTWIYPWADTGQSKHYHNYDTGNELLYLIQHVRFSKIVEGVEGWWGYFLKRQANAHNPDLKGLLAVMKTHHECFKTLATQYPLEWMFFCWLCSGRTYDSNTNNSFLKAFFTECGFDPSKIAAEARQMMKSPGEIPISGFDTRKEPYPGARRAFCLLLPTSSEIVREKEAKTDYRKHTTNGAKADGLGIEALLFPKLRAAVESGDIPTSVFSNPNGAPINREFALWERALNQKGWDEPIFKIAQDAGRRSTYEKDVTPYLAFLFKLGPYLDRYTPGRKKWTCFPSYVESEWQLEMNDENGNGPNVNGTVKRRSALTPVANNKTRVVRVPYVAVCVTGRVAQWCYSKEYYVFEDLMVDPISKGIVVNGVETKLNGRDDYGLMFYTLNGTATATGYPTFLIIFERRTQQKDVGAMHPDCWVCHPELNNLGNRGDYPHKDCKRCHPDPFNDTFVHFHRVHPKRVVDGMYTPACKLIETTYQYMAGNIPATDIVAQQGDMVYLACPHNPIEAGVKVSPTPQVGRSLDYESHNHVALGKGEIRLFTSEAKTPANRLGYIEVPWGGMTIRHPEHDDVQYLAKGWYEVRRCRSWEANPKAIWSLTID